MKKLICLLLVIFAFVFVGCNKTIEISFDSDGGSAINTITLEGPGKVTKPEDPTKSNAVFNGWTLKGEQFDFETEVKKSITLKATWLDAVNVTFTGAGFDEYSVLVVIGESYKLPTIERSGYTFRGWINTATNKKVDDDYIYEEDTFLEAAWDKKTQYAITYYNGLNAIYKDYAYEGDEYTAYVTSLEGYSFDGWYKDEECTEEFDFTKLARTNNIYGKFTPLTYTVSFEGTDKVLTATYAKRIGTLPVVTQTDCTFIGWQYEGKTITNLTTYLYTSDIKLSPIFQTKSTFVIDSSTKKIVTYTIGATEPYVSLSKSGYIFAGWYDNSDFNGDPIYLIDTTDYANKTLYAKWVTEDKDDTLKAKVMELVINYYTDLYKDKVIYENMNLKNLDPYYGVTLTWTSNNKQALQNNGTITRTKENVSVKLTLNASYNNYTQTIEIPVTIKADLYKDLSKSVITAYVYTGTYNSRPVDEILLDTVDVINFCFAVPNVDGTITLQQDYLTKLEKFQADAIAKGVRVVMVLGDSGAATFSTIAHDDEARATYVNQILEYIKKYNFAGVDIDWEYPTENEKTYYTLMMKDIYEAVKAYDPELLVTSAIPAGPWGYPKYDLKNSVQYLDYINLMSYDMECSGVGGPAYHHTALYKSSKTYNMCSIEETVNYFVKYQNVPLNKIVIGAAFYSRYSSLSSKNGSITDSVVGKTVKYSTVKQLIDSGVEESWDDTAKAPYLYDPNTKLFYSYDNPKSLKLKCEYVISKGVAGIMWWDYGSDPTGTLIQAINECLDILK